MSGAEVGFIGLGNIGLPIARRLAAVGHRLVVCDRDPARAELLAGDGVEAVATPSAVASRAETVFTSLPSPEALRAVALGADGVAGERRIQQLVDLSTVGPETSRTVAAELEAHGVVFIDAPVSGGPVGAAQGSLAIMVAGAQAARERVRPLLENLGRPFVVGDEPGMGQVMKLVNNYLSASALAVTSEALVYGAKGGLDPQVMIDVLNAASGRNSATLDKFPRAVLPGTFDYGFGTGLMCKDLRLFSEDAEALGVPLFVGSAVRQMWRHVSDQRGPDSDFTEIVRPLELWTGVEVRARDSGSG